MKLLLSLILIISSSVFANSVDIKRFTYTGQNNLEQVNLSTEVTKTIYENRTVRSTCYRTSTRRQCRRVCSSNRRCRTICRNVIVRRPYTCYRNRRVAVQVFDYENISDLTFSFDSPDTNTNFNEDFTITQRGSNFDVDVNGSGNQLIRLRKTSENITRDNDVRYVKTDFAVSFTNVALGSKVLSSGLTGVKLSSNVLTFNVGSGYNLKDFDLNLKLYRNRRFGSDILILDRDVRNVAKLNDNGFITEVTIDLNELGVNVPNNKRIIIDTKYDIDLTGALNAQELKLSASENWIFR